MAVEYDYGPPPAGFQDHVVKKEHGVKLPVRFWPAKTSSKDKPAPWLLYIHGGGFQGGTPYTIQRWIFTAFKDYHIVSAAYRFIPEVTLDDQLKDVSDTAQWVRQNLAKYVDGVDLDAYVVAGDSAGGTLATLSGLELSPSPRAVVNLYGVVDMLDPHFQKHANERYMEHLKLTPELEEKIKAVLAVRDPAQARYVRPWRWELPPVLKEGGIQVFWGKPDYVVDESDLLNLDAYDYVGLKGIRLELLFRKDGDDEAFKQRAKKGSSLFRLDDRKEYPPTFILHGTGDDVVPVSQGKRFEAKLKELGVPVESAYPEGKAHAFDQLVYDPNGEDWKSCITPLASFVDKHVRGL